MCGIVGVAGWIGQNESKMFRTMLLWDTIRGLDSTGVMAVDFTNHVIVEKDLGGPTNLWDYNDSKIFNALKLPKTTHKILLGHNRAATIGKVTVDNAHPFTYGDITGVHNGTLRQWDDINPGKQFSIDSKALINAINEHGIVEAWRLFSGAAAVVAYNSKTNELMFARNDERPLTFAYAADKRTLFWASEAWMIRLSAERFGVKLEQFPATEEKKGDAIWQYPVNTVTTYEISSNNVTYKSREVIANKVVNFPTPGGVNGSHTYYKPGNKTGVNAGFKPMNQQILNAAVSFFDRGPRHRTIAFAANSIKAPKEVRGKDIIINSFGDKYINDEWVPVFRGICLYDDVRVEVYPLNKVHMETMKEALEGAGNISIKYRIHARPRVSQTYVGSNLEPVYRISSADIKRVFTGPNNVIPLPPKTEKMYVGPFNELMCEDELRRQFKDAGGSCAACDNPLVVEDAHKYEWVNRAYPICLCEECKGNEYFRSLVMS